MSSSRSSTGRSRARATAPPASVSRRRGAVLAGKGGLENVMDLVLVQTVVRRRRRGFRPDTGDAEIPGELTAASRNGRSLALRREGWPLAESVLKRVRDRYRPRRARLLAHEARLALEDARLRLEQKSDEPPRPFGQIALLIRVLAGNRLGMHKMLQSPEHARD